MKRAHLPSAPFPTSKTLSCLSAALLVWAAGTLGAAPLLHFDFDTPGSSQTSTGSLALTLATQEGSTPVNKTTASPAGPDGSSVLNFSGAPQNTTLGTNISSQTAFTTGLGSFTITAWVLNNTTAANERIFYLRGGTKVAIDFNMTGTPGNPAQLILAVNGATAVGSLMGGVGSPISIPNVNPVWQMVAVTYDAATGSVVFYSGELEGALKSYAPNAKLTEAAVTNSTFLSIGNINGGGRILDSYLDEVSFYNYVLTPLEMQQVFEAVPEPGSMAAVLLGGLVLAGAARRRFFSAAAAPALMLAAALPATANAEDLFTNGNLAALENGHPTGWPLGGVTDPENYEVQTLTDGPAEAPVSVRMVSHMAETSRYLSQQLPVEPGASYQWRARVSQNGGRGLMWVAAVADPTGNPVNWEARTYLSSYIGHPLYPRFVSGDKMRGSDAKGWREEMVSFTVPKNVARVRFSIGIYFSTADLRVGPMSLTKLSGPRPL